MNRLIREILHAIPRDEEKKTKKRRMSPLAVDVIQELAEDYIVKRFKASQIMSIHAKRITVQPEDWNNAVKVMTVLTGHEQPSDITPINERFSHKKAGRAKKTITETTTNDELSDSYLLELSRIDRDMHREAESNDESDSLDLCYQMEAEEESDSEEFHMHDEPYSL